jgi:hypothetical protein
MMFLFAEMKMVNDFVCPSGVSSKHCSAFHKCIVPLDNHHRTEIKQAIASIGIACCCKSSQAWNPGVFGQPVDRYSEGCPPAGSVVFMQIF